MRLTPRQGAQKLRQIARNLQRELRQAESDNIWLAKYLAQKQTSGTLASRELAELGHPYSRRRPNPAFDPAVVNVHAGDLWAGWQKQEPRAQGDSLVSRVYNTDPKAAEVEAGTPLTLARPVTEAVVKALEPLRNARLQRAIDTAWRP